MLYGHLLLHVHTHKWPDKYLKNKKDPNRRHGFFSFPRHRYIGALPWDPYMYEIKRSILTVVCLLFISFHSNNHASADAFSIRGERTLKGWRSTWLNINLRVSYRQTRVDDHPAALKAFHFLLLLLSFFSRQRERISPSVAAVAIQPTPLSSNVPLALYMQMSFKTFQHVPIFGLDWTSINAFLQYFPTAFWSNQPMLGFEIQLNVKVCSFFFLRSLLPS